MLAIEDARIPGLADLSQERLCAITGADEVDLLRLRYRPGKRAILHVATRTEADTNEGTVWFFGGDKAIRFARQNNNMTHFDPETQALFEAFPQDHRMPQIRNFLAQYETIVSDMTGHDVGAPPVLLRYRPGLSCTFRCTLDRHPAAYIKLIKDDDPVRLRNANLAMQDVLLGSDLSVAPVLGINADLGAIAYGSAAGVPLDAALSDSGNLLPLEQAITALRHFWSAPLAPSRRKGRDMLLNRARDSANLIAVTAPSCHAEITTILTRLEALVPDAPLCPIHGDVKLEHVFLGDGSTTLIDTESVSLGFADYDLAQLYGRLWQSEREGQLPHHIAKAGSAYVRSQAGPAFEWSLGIVAIGLAKFYAQRPGRNTEKFIHAILQRVL